ncbi:ubiquitin specific protease 44 isoform 2, putative [Acanthamoeba castellanii str. Neff]|uniref:Ubiquitin specific protease 44 isoform 2, putative n=1 Tax=Acanthamoeba castellanii (strain ATCC 30010 / Neff) TaxID=1257118 RepID=L8H4Q3_ACACF|nr:ubiquitin specific protease 44 isoform 2, putative [Acanthamoeba castellanii str. Neff]ELR20504.1 ubiquitin specific protease 44 isoform 2, putative [Acanthamoeba castellanii str. Neff]
MKKKHELERDAKEEQEPHSGEAEDEGEAERKQNNDKEETLHQEGVVGEEDAPAPVFATPPPPKRRAKRRKGLLADLDMDGPSLSSISAEIHNIFRVVWSGRWAVVTPFALLDALWKFVPRFRNYQQQDAQEFLVYLLDKLHDELTSLNGGREVVASPSGQKRQGESIISKTFNGELLSQVTCSACGNVSSRREPYLDLLLDIPIQHAGGSRSTRGNRKTNVPSCSLYDCLDSFTWPEKLTGYYCEKCKSNQDASKRLAIQTLPDRFCWTTTSRAKVDTKVLFPLIGLDLSAFCSEERENAIFDLSSVVIHHGSGPSAGHYTAFCYHTEQGTWLHFNDCRVSVSSPQEAASAQAYMLFYQRRSASDSKIPIPAVIPAGGGEHNNDNNDNHNNSNKRKQRRGTKKSKETDGEEEDVDGDDDEKEAAGKRKQRGTAKRRRVDEADEKKQQRRDERDLEALKRDELVVALRKRGLRTTGAKAVLLKRLQDAIRHDNDDDDQADDDGDGDDSGGRDDGDDSEQENEKTSKPRPAADSGVTKRRLAKRTNRGTNK